MSATVNSTYTQLLYISEAVFCVHNPNVRKDVVTGTHITWV